MVVLGASPDGLNAPIVVAVERCRVLSVAPVATMQIAQIPSLYSLSLAMRLQDVAGASEIGLLATQAADRDTRPA